MYTFQELDTEEALIENNEGKKKIFLMRVESLAELEDNTQED